MEYYLSLDPFNFLDEIEYRIFNDEIDLFDLNDLCVNGFIDEANYKYYVDYYNFLNKGGIDV